MSGSNQSPIPKKNQLLFKSRQVQAIILLICCVLGVVIWKIATRSPSPEISNNSGLESNSKSPNIGTTDSPEPQPSFSLNLLASPPPGFNPETQTEPPNEASSAFYKFECNASLLIRNFGTNQSIQLTLTTPKIVDSAWVSLNIGSNNSKLEIDLTDGFAQKIIGQKSSTKKELIEVKIYPVPIFNEGMELCSAIK